MKTRQARKNEMSAGQREIFPQIKVVSRRNTLCIARLTKRRVGGKDPPDPAAEHFKSLSNIKRERGELAQFTPLMLPFRL